MKILMSLDLAWPREFFCRGLENHIHSWRDLLMDGRFWDEPIQSKRPFEIIINQFFIPTTVVKIVELVVFFTVL